MLLKDYKDLLEDISGLKITNTRLAEMLGTSSQNISKRIKNQSVLTTDELTILEDKTGVYTEETINRDVRNYINYLDNKNEFIADYYPEVFGSCGTGTFVPAEYKEPMNVPIQCVNAYNANKKYSVIHAYGDSMQPYIHDKDLLVFEDYNGEQICDNRIYVFRYEDKIFIKRLVLNINQLIIKSDNAEYKPITVDLKDADIQIIGKFAGLMRKAE